MCITSSRPLVRLRLVLTARGLGMGRLTGLFGQRHDRLAARQRYARGTTDSGWLYFLKKQFFWPCGVCSLGPAWSSRLPPAAEMTRCASARGVVLLLVPGAGAAGRLTLEINVALGISGNPSFGKFRWRLVVVAADRPRVASYTAGGGCARGVYALTASHAGTLFSVPLAPSPPLLAHVARSRQNRMARRLSPALELIVGP